MKRTPFLIAVPLIIGSMAVCLLVALLSRVILQPSTWRAEVDHYIRYRGDVAFVSGQRATLPGAFAPAFSAVTYGSSLDAGVDFSYRDDPARPAATLYPAARAPVSSPKPLAYPPTDVYCITLRPTGAGGPPAPAAVYVVRHDDLYQTTWVTHEPAVDPAVINAAVGCPAPGSK